MKKVVCSALFSILIVIQVLQVSSVNAQEITSISVSKSPYGIAINSNTQRVYVATTDSILSSSVSVIDTLTNLILSDIALPAPSKRLAVNPNTNKVFVHAVFPTGNGVSIINALPNSLENTFFFNGVSLSNFNSVIHSKVHLKDILGGITANPITDMIYGANYNFSSTFTFNGQNLLGSLVLIKLSPSSGLSGFMPYWTDVNTVTNRIYFVHSKVVDVSDALTNSIIATIRFPASELSGAAVNSTANKIYVGRSLGGFHFVSVIDGSNDSILSNIEVAAPVINVTLNPNTNKIYTLLNNETGPKLIYINGSTNNIIASFNIGNAGDLVDSVAVDPNTEKVYVSFPELKLVKVFDGSLNNIDPPLAVSSNDSLINLSQDFTGVWKAFDSKIIKLSLCIKDSKIDGVINQRGVLESGVITYGIPTSENEVVVNVEDKNNKSANLKLELIGQRQLLLIFEDGHSVKARKIDSFRACFVQGNGEQDINSSKPSEANSTTIIEINKHPAAAPSNGSVEPQPNSIANEAPNSYSDKLNNSHSTDNLPSGHLVETSPTNTNSSGQSTPSLQNPGPPSQASPISSEPTINFPTISLPTPAIQANTNPSTTSSATTNPPIIEVSSLPNPNHPTVVPPTENTTTPPVTPSNPTSPVPTISMSASAEPPTMTQGNVDAAQNNSTGTGNGNGNGNSKH